MTGSSLTIVHQVLAFNQQKQKEIFSGWLQLIVLDQNTCAIHSVQSSPTSASFEMQ